VDAAVRAEWGDRKGLRVKAVPDRGRDAAASGHGGKEPAVNDPGREARELHSNRVSGRRQDPLESSQS